MNQSEKELSRREILKGAVALSATAAAITASTSATAASSDHKHHHHANKNTAVIDTALDCIKTGNACADHCFVLLKSGEESKEMAACAESVDEMLTMTNTLMKLASQQSKHLKAFAQLCKTACEDCAEECDKHADKHVECKNCMAACEDCAEACANVV